MISLLFLAPHSPHASVLCNCHRLRSRHQPSTDPRLVCSIDIIAAHPSLFVHCSSLISEIIVRFVSKLKLLKIYLRSTIQEERLNGLAIYIIEKNVLDNIDLKGISELLSYTLIWGNHIHYFTVLLVSFVEYHCLLWTKYMVHINCYSTTKCFVHHVTNEKKN